MKGEMDIEHRSGRQGTPGGTAASYGFADVWRCLGVFGDICSKRHGGWGGGGTGGEREL